MKDNYPNEEFQIDRESPVPYYHQLKLFLLGEIRSGRLKQGQKLPSEAELCNTYTISRTVVRQTIKELQNEGYLTTEKGKGTFISRPRIVEGFVQSLSGFYEDMMKRGYRVSTHILKQELIPSSHHISQQLRIEERTPVVAISRIRKLDDEPSVYVTTYVPQEICPKLLNADLENKSLYSFLEQNCGLEIFRGHRYIGVALANEYEASLLNIDVGSPLIELESVSYLRDGRPLEYFHALHRGDRTKFEVELVRFKARGRE